MPDGRWRVIGDRTQSPLGVGYALENRVVLSRVLPSLFRDSHVHRLAGFFRSMRRTLTAARAATGRACRVVVLTPGRRTRPTSSTPIWPTISATPWSRAATSRCATGRCGCAPWGVWSASTPCCAGSTTTGATRWSCARTRCSASPVWSQAVRAGNVVVANAFGSGVLEHPGSWPSCRALCQQLLGEELLLPDIPTWWCGNPKALDHGARTNLDGLVIKRPASPRAALPLPGHHGAERPRRADRCHRGQPRRATSRRRRVKPSTAPALIGQHLEPRPSVLRTFLVAEEDGYAVMPGGLGRVTLSSDAALISNQLGGLGKDVWVLASEPERQESLLVAAEMQTPGGHPGERGLQPGRRQSVLDRALRRARRGTGATAAHHHLQALRAQPTTRSATGESCCLRSLLEALTNQTQSFPGFIGTAPRSVCATRCPRCSR